MPPQPHPRFCQAERSRQREIQTHGGGGYGGGGTRKETLEKISKTKTRGQPGWGGKRQLKNKRVGGGFTEQTTISKPRGQSREKAFKKTGGPTKSKFPQMGTRTDSATEKDQGSRERGAGKKNMSLQFGRSSCICPVMT